MDWRAKVELYEQIRREYEFGVGSVIGVARKLGVHRRMVREAVRNAVPAQRKKTERPAVKMAPAVSLIESILELDRKAPRKQRHTSRRIYDRIRAEIPGCTPAERTVRQYVERRKQALGLAEHEVFVPQSYDWGVEAQVDWYEAYADLDGERIKLQVFEMRSMASGAAFHRAYPCATQHLRTACTVILPPNAMDAVTDRLNLQSTIHAEGVPQCNSASKRRSARDPSGVVRRTQTLPRLICKHWPT